MRTSSLCLNLAAGEVTMGKVTILLPKRDNYSLGLPGLWLSAISPWERLGSSCSCSFFLMGVSQQKLFPVICSDVSLCPS